MPARPRQVYIPALGWSFIDTLIFILATFTTIGLDPASPAYSTKGTVLKTASSWILSSFPRVSREYPPGSRSGPGVRPWHNTCRRRKRLACLALCLLRAALPCLAWLARVHMTLSLWRPYPGFDGPFVTPENSKFSAHPYAPGKYKGVKVFTCVRNRAACARGGGHGRSSSLTPLPTRTALAPGQTVPNTGPLYF